jgi:hypothetical protein
MDSLLTMLMFQYAFDIAGFQGNATFDTARNALWTAHCTAPLKMEGPDSEDAPYLLRGHSEVRGSGCVPEIQYRMGQVITRTKLINLDTILVSTGEIIDVPEKAVHGCRTQIVTKVRDAASNGGRLGQGVGNRRRHDAATPRGVLRRSHAEHATSGQLDRPESRRGSLTGSRWLSEILLQSDTWLVSKKFGENCLRPAFLARRLNLA